MSRFRRRMPTRWRGKVRTARPSQITRFRECSGVVRDKFGRWRDQDGTGVGQQNRPYAPMHPWCFWVGLTGDNGTVSHARHAAGPASLVHLRPNSPPVLTSLAHPCARSTARGRPEIEREHSGGGARRTNGHGSGAHQNDREVTRRKASSGNRALQTCQSTVVTQRQRRLIREKVGRTVITAVEQVPPTRRAWLELPDERRGADLRSPPADSVLMSG